VALGYAVFSDLPILPSAEGTVLAVAGGTVIGVGIFAYYVALTHTSVGIATTIIAMYFVVAVVLKGIFRTRRGDSPSLPGSRSLPSRCT